MRSLSLIVVVVVLAPGAVAPAIADRPSSAIPPACLKRFERGREELIERGFAPTRDKDTQRWLVVDQSPSSVHLSLQMRTSADGAATFYMASVKHPRGGFVPSRWRVHRGPYCCDEHASREDHLFEHRWSRARNGLQATVSVVELEEAQNDRATIRWRDMFARVGREMTDDCLAAARP